MEGTHAQTHSFGDECHVESEIGVTCTAWMT